MELSEHAMAEITYESLSYDLVEALPELRDASDWGTYVREGPHALFSDALVPWLGALLGNPANHEPLLRRTFDLLEVLATHEDKYIVNLIAVSMLEPLQSRPEALLEARRWMGPGTLEILADIERGW